MLSKGQTWANVKVIITFRAFLVCFFCEEYTCLRQTALKGCYSERDPHYCLRSFNLSLGIFVFQRR